jgi:hypothetical protein
MIAATIRDGEDLAIVQELTELDDVRGVCLWERIGDEVYPYFADDRGRCAFPDDGRLAVEP